MAPKNQKATLTGRKMAKKGGQTSLQMEINSDEEWKLIMQREGLIVIDIYTDWCGPCVGMMSNLKRVKLEMGNEYLNLGMANSDKITALSRFRGYSEPTWVFIASGQLVRVMFGSDAPLLMETIINEMNIETACIQGTRKRVQHPFDEITTEETARNAKLAAKKKKEEADTRRDIEEQFDKIKRRYYERVARRKTKHSVVLFFPHTFKEETTGDQVKRTCPPAYKLMAQYDQVGVSIKDQLEVQLTRETIAKVFYNSGVLFPPTLLRSLEQAPCIASLIQDWDSDNDAFLSPSELKMHALESIDIIEDKLAKLVYGPGLDPLNPDPGTVAKEFMMTTPKGVIIPPMWTPREHISKAAALDVVFPNMVEELGIEMESLPPPAYVMFFEATRAKEILEAAAPFAEDIMHIAFFDKADPETAQKICQTVYEYEKLPISQRREMKLGIALQKAQSHPMLVLAQLGPIYMSGDVKQGVKEVEMLFPPQIEEVLEPDPWGPAPEDSEEGFFMDEEGNCYREEGVEGANGEINYVKRYFRLADGRTVNVVVGLDEPFKMEEEVEEEEGEEEEGEEEAKPEMVYDDTSEGTQSAGQTESTKEEEAPEKKRSSESL